MAANGPLRPPSFQFDNVELIVKVSGALSLVGCVAMMVDILLNWKKLRNSPHRIVLYWTLADLMLTPASIASRAFVQQSALCVVQGWLVQISLMSSMLWGAALATSTLMSIGFQYTIPYILSYEPCYHLIAWGIPVLFGTSPILLSLSTDTPFYGDAQLWCWIGAKYETVRICFLFGPLYAILLYCAGVYLFVGIKIWRYTKDSNLIETALSKSTGARKRYAFKASMYILALLIAWIPATILHAACVPLQGALNALVYFSPHMYTACSAIKWSQRSRSQSISSVTAVHKLPISRFDDSVSVTTAGTIP